MPSPIYTERTTCRSCQSKTLVHVLSLGDQYLCAFPQHVDPGLPKAPLTLVRCGVCGLLQLLHSVERDLLYGEYWYRSSVNQTMREALKDLVNDALKFVDTGAWLDIGANDGCLLSHVPDKFHKTACEPSRTFHSQLEEFADEVIPTYFSRSETEKSYDVITSAAMFYDLDDPLSFSKDIAASLAPNGIWINQLNDAPTMLDRNAFDGICHEHLCYYTAHDLEALYRRAGLKIIALRFNEINGGSMRVFAMRSDSGIGEKNLAGYPKVSPVDAEEFSDRVLRWREIMHSVLDGGSLKYAPIWCYGASTKGSTLLQFLGMNERFYAVADRNPAKHGRFMVGSWLPITDEVTMRKAKPRCMVVLPWAFRAEFVAREAATRKDGTIQMFPLPNPEFVL